MTTLYGWTEQNGASWGIDTIETDLAPHELDLDEHHEVQNYSGIPLGRWFSHFSSAKRAAIEHWQSELDIAKAALRDIRTLKKADIG